MSRLHVTNGNSRHWQFRSRPQDASLRYLMHGPIQPLDQEPRLEWRTALWVVPTVGMFLAVFWVAT